MVTVVIVLRINAISMAFQAEVQKSKELSESLSFIVNYCEESKSQVMPHELYSDAKSALKRKSTSSYYSNPWLIRWELLGLLAMAIVIDYMILKGPAASKRPNVGDHPKCTT